MTKVQKEELTLLTIIGAERRDEHGNEKGSIAVSILSG